MDRVRNGVVITKLIETLRERGSWCGETHVQKAAFFLQELMEVPMRFNFILYKHGPFSFDLRDELTALRADGLIQLEARSYGAKLVPTARVTHVHSLYAKTVTQYGSAIEFVADRLGNKNVGELERLGTAYYVTKRLLEASASIKERAGRITALKPHVSWLQARLAVEEVDGLLEERAHQRLDTGLPHVEIGKPTATARAGRDYSHL